MMRTINWAGTLVAAILALSLGTAAPGQAAAPPREDSVSVVVLLDRSGSIQRTDPDGLGLAAAAYVIEQVSLSGDANRVAVVPFSSTACILGQERPNPAAAFSTQAPALIEMLMAGGTGNPEFRFRESVPGNPAGFLRLLREQMRFGQHTELEKALDLARQILRGAPASSRKIVFLVSDGMPVPDLTNPERVRELASEVGADLARQAAAGKSAAIGGLQRRHTEHIVTNVLPAMAREGIAVYPVAFHKKGEPTPALSGFLMRVKKVTTGDEDIVDSDPDTLVPKLAGFVPTGENYIQLRKAEGIAAAGTPSKRIDVAVPDIALQSRFFLSFRNARRSQSPRVKVYRGGQLVADSAAPPQGGGVAVTEARRTDGAIVFQSVRLLNPAVARGRFTLEVSGDGSGGDGLPDTDLLIDFRSNLYADIEVRPENPPAGAPVEARIRLFAPGPQPLAMTVEGGDVFLIGRAPDEVRGVSDHLRNVSIDRGAVVVSIPDGIPKAGRYALRFQLHFRPPGTSDLVSSRFEALFSIGSALPLQGNVWLARKGSGARREEGLKVTLPPIAEEFSSTFTGLEVRTSLGQALNDVKASLAPFRHVERGEELSSAGENWAKVTPPFPRGLSKSSAVPLNLSVTVPMEVPPDIPDGVYQSVLAIGAGSEVLDSVPVTIGVSVPRFVFDRKEGSRSFDPEAHAQGTEILRHVLYPYPGGDYDVPIRLWSTSLKGTPATVSLPERKGLKVVSGMAGEERIEHVLFEVPEGATEIPGKNNRLAGKVVLKVRILDPSLDGMTVTNTVFVRGKQHRELPVKITMKIRFLPLAGLYPFYAAILAGGVLLGWRRIAFRGRMWLVRGRNIQIHLEEGTPKESEFNHGRHLLGKAQYDGRPLGGGFANLNTVLKFVAEGAEYQRDSEEWFDAGEGYFPQQGDKIRIGKGKRGYLFRVQRVPTDPAEPEFVLATEKSPVGRGWLRHMLEVLAVVLTGVALVGIVSPYFWLRLFRL